MLPGDFADLLPPGVTDCWVECRTAQNGRLMPLAENDGVFRHAV
jgi:hypothetical protein